MRTIILRRCPLGEVFLCVENFDPLIVNILHDKYFDLYYLYYYIFHTKQPHTGCAISTETQKNLNSSITTGAKELIFSPKIEAHSHSKSIRTRLVRSCVKYIVSFSYL